MTVIKTDLLACYVPVLPCALFIIKSMKGYRQVLMRQEIAEDKRNIKKHCLCTPHGPLVRKMSKYYHY